MHGLTQFLKLRVANPLLYKLGNEEVIFPDCHKHKEIQSFIDKFLFRSKTSYY